MGGYGSGRRPGKKKQDLQPYVDLRLLRRKGALANGCVSVLQWFKNGRYIGGAKVIVAGDQIDLVCHIQTSALDSYQYNTSANLSYTPCYFGGVRPWIRCPGCYRKVLILYAGLNSCRCRHCFNLTYASRSEGKVDLILRRVRKVRSQLGTSANLSVPIDSRPKGMHHSTYDRLRLKAIIDQKNIIRAMEEKFRKTYKSKSPDQLGNYPKGGLS